MATPPQKIVLPKVVLPDALRAAIAPTSNVIDRGISFVIYSDPGVGKTTLASTLPDDETLIINTEAGLGPILGKRHRVFNLKENLAQLEDLYEKLKNDPKFFNFEPQHKDIKYVVIDNVSELEQWMIHALTQMRKKDFVELKEYGDSSYKMRQYLRLFRDLIYDGISVVFNAWELPIEYEVHGGEVKTKIFPKLSKKLAIELCGLVDVVGHLEKYDKTGDRYIRFEGSTEVEAKSQFKGLDKFMAADFPTILKTLYAYDYKVKKGEEDGYKL